MAWKPWQMWLALAWGLLALVITVLFLAGVVAEGVILATIIISGAFAALVALLDRRARNKILQQHPDDEEASAQLPIVHSDRDQIHEE